ncbi:MAG: LysM peptidoglycan-binding domain-containing protein [Lentisphaerae bacterium]|nr:LysM peptidoglycan-binding domain-containing protein [Lentisphaerota bacterium]
MIAVSNYRAAVAVALLLSAGCARSVGDADARDRATPAFDRAIRTEHSGKLDEAITQYEQVLLDHPRMVSAHLHLALLLHDHRQDYYGAVYHYRQYLKLRQGGEKDELVQGRIRLAEQLLAAQLLRRVGDLAGIAQSRLTEQVDTLSRRVTALEGEKTGLIDEKEKLTQSLQTSEREAQRLRHLLKSMQIPDQPTAATETRPGAQITATRDEQAVREPAASAAPSVSRSAITAAREEAARLMSGTPPPKNPVAPVRTTEPVPPQPAAVPPPVPPKPVAVAVPEVPKPVAEPAVKRKPEFRTYVVQPGDTLFRIAERHYGDGSKWTTVRDSNKSRISSDGRVRVGQILLIP